MTNSIWHGSREHTHQTEKEGQTGGKGENTDKNEKGKERHWRSGRKLILKENNTVNNRVKGRK